MSEHPQVVHADSQQDMLAAPPEPRWPAVAAFVTAWLCPAISARRTLHVRLWAAFAVHLLAAFLTFVLITMLASLTDYKNAFTYFDEIIEEFTSDRWQQAVAALAASVLGIEIAFLILALVLTPWGAADERLRSSWSHALRVTWLHTSHALPVVLLVGLLILAYSIANWIYSQAHPYISSMTWKEWNGNKPFILRYDSVAIVWSGVGCGVWVLWALLRAAVVRRPAPPIVRPPICEFCGYNLTATPIESRCPECGQLAIDSLGPQVRPGTPWDHAEYCGRLRAWWRCGVDAICQPRQFGHQMRIGPTNCRHRRFLAIHLPLVFLFGALGAAGCFFYGWHKYSHYSDYPEMFRGLPPVFGGLSVLTALTITGLAAGLVGLIYSLQNQKNLLPASMRMACYLGLYITAWTAFIAALTVVLFVLDSEGKLRPLARQIKMDHEFLLFCLWFLPNLALLAGFLVLLWRGTGAAQYANR